MKEKDYRALRITLDTAPDGPLKFDKEKLMKAGIKDYVLKSLYLHHLNKFIESGFIKEAGDYSIMLRWDWNRPLSYRAKCIKH